MPTRARLTDRTGMVGVQARLLTPDGEDRVLTAAPSLPIPPFRIYAVIVLE